MIFALSILIGLAGLGLIIFGLGYSAAFLAARSVFDRALASEVADQGKAYVENALARIKSEFVRKYVIGQMGSMAGAAAVSMARGALSSGIQKGFMISGAGLLCVILAFNVPWLLPALWPK